MYGGRLGQQLQPSSTSSCHCAQRRMQSDTRPKISTGRSGLPEKLACEAITVPWQGEDISGWSIGRNQRPEEVAVAVLRIDRAGQDRVLAQCPCGTEVIKWMNF